MSKPKRQLSFDYNSIFQDSMVPTWIEDIGPLYRQFSTLKKSGVKDLRAYLAQFPAEVFNLASKIEVVDVNKATVAMYGAKTPAEFLGKLDQLMNTIDADIFVDALVSFWNQDDEFSLESTHCSFDNKPLTTIISARIPRFGSDQLMIPVTITDVSQLRDEQKALTEALEEVKTLRGIIPICASCKKIRDDEGFWNQIEQYISDRTEAMFTHGICPDCSKRLYSLEHDKN